MTADLTHLVAAANAFVPRISPPQANEMMARGGIVIIDLRDPGDIAATGKIADAMPIPAADLEARADHSSPEHDRRLDKAKTIILYCSRGTHAAIGGKLLKELGFPNVFNLGAFEDWLESSPADAPSCPLLATGT
jgi:rhodanese-related sulfurtransferase